MKLIYVFCLVTTLGCATYTKPGATKADWQRDKNDCTVKLNQAGLANNSWQRSQFLQECIEGQGWTRGASN